MSGFTAPEPAPAAAPEPTPAAPAPAAPAPAAAPAEPAPSAEPTSDDLYPTDFGPSQTGKVVHETVINGRRVTLTSDDVDRMTHTLVTQETERLQAERKAQQEAAAKAATPAEAEGASEEVKRLNKELKELQLKVQTQENNQLVKSTREAIEKTVADELGEQKVFKDHPNLVEIGRQQAFALLSANTKMTEKEAVQKVAAMQGEAINKVKEGYIKGKISDAKESEALPGGGAVATPGPKPATGKDLMKGRIRDRAMKRIMEAQVT